MSRGVRISDVKRDWGDDDSATPILHIDMDAFFVSVELLDQPHLHGKPVAVGGHERGVISAASYAAREYGVNSAMPVARAKKLCPDLILLPVNMEKYRAVSAQIMAIFAQVTPLIEQISVDEAFIDVGGVRKLFGSPLTIAKSLRARIRNEVGVPASIGIANTKHLAKLASTHAKPDGLLLVPAACSQEFLDLLPISALWGVGEKTAQRLMQRGIESVTDVHAVGVRRLQAIVGQAAGAKIYALATNQDSRSVVDSREEKSLSREQTFFDPITSMPKVHRALLAQSEELACRLRREGLRALNVSLKIRTGKFETITRSRSLQSATFLGLEIYSAAVHLFSQLPFPASGIRLIGVRVANLQSRMQAVQDPLDADQRSEAAARAIDSVREKYGMEALSLATLCNRDAKPELPSGESRG